MTDMNNLTDRDLQDVSGGSGEAERKEVFDFLEKAHAEGLISNDKYAKMIKYYLDIMQQEGEVPVLVEKAKTAGIITFYEYRDLLDYYFKD